jgi:uncharacterized protein with GYD domain
MPRQGEYCIPTYISLCRWTLQGVTTIEGSPARLDAAKKAFAEAGIQVLSFYLTTGSHDMVILTEAPNDEMLARRVQTIQTKRPGFVLPVWNFGLMKSPAVAGLFFFTDLNHENYGLTNSPVKVNVPRTVPPPSKGFP